MSTNSPIHQAILTNSVSHLSDAFARPSHSVMSTKPDVALRVPINRDEIIQK